MTRALRGLCLVLAASLLAFALRDPSSWTAEGALKGSFLLIVALAGAVLVAGFSARTEWMPSALWLALALAGQAAALQLIDAGPRLHYQHYRSPAEALSRAEFRPALLLVLVQAGCVAAGLLQRKREILAWLRKPRHIAQTFAVLILCGAASAAVSRDAYFFLLEASLALFVQIVNAGNILLLAWMLPVNGLSSLARQFDRFLGGRENRKPSLDRFAIGTALSVVMLSALLAWLVYQRHPHVSDEVVYLYNARYFADGQITMPPPAVPKAFDVDLMEYLPDKWFSAVPLGWPAVLALGVRVHAAWLVNPVLAGCNILLAYLLLWEIYSRRTARIAILLLACSPWNVFLAMSFMTHTLTFTCALAAFLGVALARRTGKTGWAWVGGLGAGAGTLIRPLDGLIVVILTGSWAIGLGGSRLRWKGLAAVAAGGVMAGAVALPYNKVLTGDAARSPLIDYTDRYYGPKTNAYGFGPERGLGWALDPYPGHSPSEALINAELNASSVNVELLGWSTGSFVLIAILLVSGGMRRPDLLMTAVIAAVVLAYAPYWFSGGPDFGARYWHLILLPSIALSARGLEWLEARFSTADRKDARAVAAVAALCFLAFLNYFPWRSLDKYYHYLNMRPDLYHIAEERGFGRSVVLVQGDRFPDYASAAVYNPIGLAGNAPVFAWDRTPEVRAEVLSRYSDRPVWIVEGPTRSHTGFRVVAGPISAPVLARTHATPGHMAPE